MSDQPAYSGSAMLALYPDPADAATLALPGALDPSGMHVTVVYVGKAADVDPVALRSVARQLATRTTISAQVSGLARFTGGPKDALVAIIDSAQIEDLRRDALSRCSGQGITVPREHGFCSHATLQYLDPTDPSPIERLDPRPLTFTAISAVHGDERTDYPFAADPQESLKATAREAYAMGWARSGGPMTPRVRAGCTAAIELAAAHPHHGIYEVTLKLGSLEGMWAKVYQRRDDLIGKNTRKVTAAWKTVLTRDMLAGAVSAYRRRSGTMESGQAGKSQDAYAADAMAAAIAMLKLLPHRPEWKSLRQAIYDAIAAGRAEGIVGAVAIAAERVDKIGLDWDLAFNHAITAFEDLDAIWAEADGWLEKMLSRATADLGRALANATRSGATYPQMLSDAMAALDSDNVAAVSFIVDWATTTALGRGALDLYASEDVSLIDWMTAGDGRVCASPCEDNEENGPYAPGSFPDFPGHPLCRCTPAANLQLANFDSWFTSA